MRFISALLRMLSGFAIMGFAGWIYLMHEAELAADKPIAIAFSSTGEVHVFAPQTIIYGLGAIAVFGLLLVLAGLITLMRKAPAAAATTEQKPPSPAPPSAT